MSKKPEDEKPEEKKPDNMFDDMIKALEGAKDMSHYEKETEIILLQSAVNYFSFLAFNLALRLIPSEQRKQLFDDALASWKKGIMLQGHEDAQQAHDIRQSPMGRLLGTMLPDEEQILIVNANAVKKIETMIRKAVMLD